MARDKSAIAVVVLFLTLGVGALVGWLARGATDTGPSDQAIAAVQSPDPSILLPRSASDDDDNAPDRTQAVESGIVTTTVADAPMTETTMSAVEQASPTSTEIAETTASSQDTSSQDTSSQVSAAENSSTTAQPSQASSTTASTAVAPTTAAPTTAAPTTAAPTTTMLVLTDPSFNSVQFQSPIACTDGSAIAEIAWDTIDASTVAILINGQSIASDLPPGGVFDANFACDGDGVHDVELIATGVSSDPARAAFTSSVTDQITTEG